MEEKRKTPMREPNIQMNIFQVTEIKLLTDYHKVNEYLKDGWVLYRVFHETSYLVALF